MTDFEYKTLKEQRRLAIKELERYYCELRKYEYENNIPLKNFTIRKMIHPLCLSIIKIDRILSGESIEVIRDDRIKTCLRPVVYACTHIGGKDIERAFEAIGNHAYLLLGDPGEAYVNMDGLILNANGYVPVQLDDKLDRHISYVRSVEVLNNKTHLLVFPEGAWNIFEHIPVMQLYKGTARMAIETGADIVPMAIEKFGSRYVVSIGRNMRTKLDMNEDVLTERLRERLTELKMEVLLSQAPETRIDTGCYKTWEGVSVKEQVALKNAYSEDYRRRYVKEKNMGFDLDYMYRTMYHENHEPTADELIAEIQDTIENNRAKQLKKVS